jgi:hypothetical protein
VFVIDSNQWTGSVHQGADGLVWHNHYRLDRTLVTVRWEAETVSRLLGTRAAALLCVHGAHVQGGGALLLPYRDELGALLRIEHVRPQAPAGLRVAALVEQMTTAVREAGE